MSTSFPTLRSAAEWHLSCLLCRTASDVQEVQLIAQVLLGLGFTDGIASSRRSGIRYRGLSRS